MLSPWLRGSPCSRDWPRPGPHHPECPASPPRPAHSLTSADTLFISIFALKLSLLYSNKVPINWKVSDISRLSKKFPQLLTLFDQGKRKCFVILWMGWWWYLEGSRWRRWWWLPRRGWRWTARWWRRTSRALRKMCLGIKSQFYWSKIVNV